MPLKLPAGSTIVPSEDMVICRMYQDEGITQEGSKLIVPETAREEVFFAHVISTGPGRTIDVGTNGEAVRKPMVCSAGDDIVFARYHGERVQIDIDLFLVLRSDDVLARVEIPHGKLGTFFRFARKGDQIESSLEAAAVRDL